MIGTPTLIIIMVIMYIAGTFVADNIFLELRMETLKEMFLVMALTALTVSLFVVFPLHLFIFHKSVLSTLPFFLAFALVHFLLSGFMLWFTSTDFKHGGKYIQSFHILQVFTLGLLIILTL